MDECTKFNMFVTKSVKYTARINRMFNEQHSLMLGRCHKKRYVALFQKLAVYDDTRLRYQAQPKSTRFDDDLARVCDNPRRGRYFDKNLIPSRINELERDDQGAGRPQYYAMRLGEEVDDLEYCDDVNQYVGMIGTQDCKDKRLALIKIGLVPLTGVGQGIVLCRRLRSRYRA
jgi:hypothetical protein